VHGGAIGIDTIMPITDFQSHFDPPGLVLRDNGFNIGDVIFGPFYQAKPVMVGGHQVLSWRAEIDFIAPTGGLIQPATSTRAPASGRSIPTSQ
jgi:hypothetical protein